MNTGVRLRTPSRLASKSSAAAAATSSTTNWSHIDMFVTPIRSQKTKQDESAFPRSPSVQSAPTRKLQTSPFHRNHLDQLTLQSHTLPLHKLSPSSVTPNSQTNSTHLPQQQQQQQLQQEHPELEQPQYQPGQQHQQEQSQKKPQQTHNNSQQHPPNQPQKYAMFLSSYSKFTEMLPITPNKITARQKSQSTPQNVYNGQSLSTPPQPSSMQLQLDSPPLSRKINNRFKEVVLIKQRQPNSDVEYRTHLRTTNLFKNLRSVVVSNDRRRAAAAFAAMKGQQIENNNSTTHTNNINSKTKSEIDLDPINSNSNQDNFQPINLNNSNTNAVQMHAFLNIQNCIQIRSKNQPPKQQPDSPKTPQQSQEQKQQQSQYHSDPTGSSQTPKHANPLSSPFTRRDIRYEHEQFNDEDDDEDCNNSLDEDDDELARTSNLLRRPRKRNLSYLSCATNSQPTDFGMQTKLHSPVRHQYMTSTTNPKRHRNSNMSYYDNSSNLLINSNSHSINSNNKSAKELRKLPIIQRLQSANSNIENPSRKAVTVEETTNNNQKYAISNKHDMKQQMTQSVQLKTPSQPLQTTANNFNKVSMSETNEDFFELKSYYDKKYKLSKKKRRIMLMRKSQELQQVQPQQIIHHLSLHQQNIQQSQRQQSKSQSCENPKILPNSVRGRINTQTESHEVILQQSIAKQPLPSQRSDTLATAIASTATVTSTSTSTTTAAAFALVSQSAEFFDPKPWDEFQPSQASPFNEESEIFTKEARNQIENSSLSLLPFQTVKRGFLRPARSNYQLDSKQS